MLGWASPTRAAWRAASDFAVPANTGEMAAYFAMQKRPPGRGVVVPLPAAAEQAAHLRGEFAGCVSPSLFQQQQQDKRHRGESAGLVSSSLFQQQQSDRYLRGESAGLASSSLSQQQQQSDRHLRGVP